MYGSYNIGYIREMTLNRLSFIFLIMVIKERVLLLMFTTEFFLLYDYKPLHLIKRIIVCCDNTVSYSETGYTNLNIRLFLMLLFCLMHCNKLEKRFNAKMEFLIPNDFCFAALYPINELFLRYDIKVLASLNYV